MFVPVKLGGSFLVEVLRTDYVSLLSDIFGVSLFTFSSSLLLLLSPAVYEVGRLLCIDSSPDPILMSSYF